jgi:hypothetical protein
MTERAVAADREQGRASLVELGRDLSQAGELRRSDATEVIAVEAEHDVATAVFTERDGPARAGGQLELRCSLAPSERRHGRILETFGRRVNHETSAPGPPRTSGRATGTGVETAGGAASSTAAAPSQGGLGPVAFRIALGSALYSMYQVRSPI